MNNKGKTTILKFDPSVDKEPRYQMFELPPEAYEGVKVIDTLRYIYENLDPSLSFREPCGQRICGACTVMVNKKAVLACDALSEREMVIEPVANRRVLKDLIVDFSREGD